MDRKLALATLPTGIGFLLVQLDVSIMNVALAPIAADIDTGVTGLQWIVDAYAIAFASLLLSAGALGDRIGSRRSFIAGLALFITASLGCATAPNVATLIVARSLQGAGASTLVPCSLALLNHAARNDSGARARAVGLWTAAGSLGLALGPVLGGMLVTTLGWRFVFLVNLPIGLAGLGLVYRFVEEAPKHGHGADIPGQVLAFAGLLCLTGSVIQAAPLGWLNPTIAIGLIMALASLIGFLYVERHSAEPMLPLGFFRDPTFSAAVLVGFLLNFSIYGALFVIGLCFQRIDHWSPMQSGLALLPLAVAVGVANLGAGWLTGFAPPRTIMSAGLLLAAVGMFLLRDIGSPVPYAAVLPGLVILPFGIGIAVPVMTTSLLGAVPRSHSGVASGILNAVRQAGGALGVAIFGAFLGGQPSGTEIMFVVATILLLGASGVARVLIGAGQCQRSGLLGAAPTRGDRG